MTNDDIYSILDLAGYAESIRKNTALSFIDNVINENLDDYISIGQVISIINNNSLGKDEDDNVLINEDSYNKTFEEVRVCLYHVGLAKLAAEGRIECAWDSDLNEMIFWTPSSELTLKSEDNEQPKSIKRNNKPKN